MEHPAKLLKLILIPVLFSCITGCGYLFGDEGMFRDKSNDYKKAREVPLIRVADGEGEAPAGELYPIPPISDTILAAGKFEVPRPAALGAGSEDEQVKIQSLGEESWTLVNNAPGQVWPQVRAFLAASQIAVARVDANAGIIETSWVSLEGQSMASRFRFRIDQGVQRGTSELHVLQMSQAGDVDSWPETSTDRAQEKEMLQAVSQFIANSADSTPVSMVADQAINTEGKIGMQEGADGDIYLRLSLPYDRAWASVGRAIEESNFEITDRDRSAGKYYVRFLGIQTEEEKGWFDWLWGSDEDPMINQQFVVSVESLDASEVTIRIDQQASAEGDDPALMTERDEQALLGLIKGNID